MQVRSQSIEGAEKAPSASVPAIPSGANTKGGNKVDSNKNKVENPFVICVQLDRERNDPASIVLPALDGHLYCLNHDPESTKLGSILFTESRSDIPGGELDGNVIESVIRIKYKSNWKSASLRLEIAPVAVI